MAEEDIRESAERDFKAYERLLETVTLFKYLGRVLMLGEDDWLAVVGNPKKARKSWSRMTRILGREGVQPKNTRDVFQVGGTGGADGSETWVLILCMGQDMDSFQHGLAWWIVGRQPNRREGG